MHPYEQLPAHAFWRRSVSQQAWHEIAFMPQTKFKLRSGERIATAGSCFAQHIAHRLSSFGLNHWISEQAPSTMSADRARELQYGVFSARYANVYTVRQLRQLVEFAFGLREGPPPVLNDRDRCVDGLRPRVTPGGYANLDDLMADRRYHLSKVRQMFSECQVFVFTLGLTEAWVDEPTGVVFPVCPGTAAGEFDPQRHRFINFDHATVLEDLHWVHDFIGKVNPSLKWIVTVSPVPLVATATSRPVLVASSHSKAVLRAAAGQFADTHANVDYFPSYEIISGTPSFGQYLESDLREVSPRGVNHVMREFAKSFVDAGNALSAPAPVDQAAQAQASPTVGEQAAHAAQIECEEVWLDRP